MKTLTICQPYAELICLSDDDSRAKRVENRTWYCAHRGPMLIHAGKSRKFLNGDNYGLSVDQMAFGALIGLVEVRDCVKIIRMETGLLVPDQAKRTWPWLVTHEHAEGPYGIILAECRRFKRPVPYRGKQALFEVPMSMNEVEALL